MFSEIFFMSFMTASFAFLTIAIRQCYKCKISELKCCGLIIKRDTVSEEKETELRIEQNIPDTSRVSSVGNNTTFLPIKGEQKV